MNFFFSLCKIWTHVLNTSSQKKRTKKKMLFMPFLHKGNVSNIILYSLYNYIEQIFENKGSYSRSFKYWFIFVQISIWYCKYVESTLGHSCRVNTRVYNGIISRGDMNSVYNNTCNTRAARHNSTSNKLHFTIL